MAPVVRRDYAHLRDLQGFRIGFELRDAVAERRVLDQWLAVRAHLARRLTGEFDPLLRFAEPRDSGALVAEQKLCDIPPEVLLTDAQRYRNPHIVEKHLVQMMASVDRNDRPPRDARRLHVDQQKRDSLLPLLGLRIGAHEAEAPICMVRGRSPDLLAIDHVIVAVTPGGGLERSEV